MAIDTRLTVLLTLKGRHLYTLRWLWHANRIKLPFPIVIADGEVNPIVARLIEDPAVFGNLQIEYRRYDDRTFRDFYLKLQDALSNIRTPYVMMSDNDDFLFSSGIIRSLGWLERSPDYVSVGGGIAHFESRREKYRMPNLNGKVDRFWYQQSRPYQAYNLESPLASERAREAYSGFLTIWYNVFRVEALRTIANEMLHFNFERLDNSELYLIMRAATLGKVRSDASCISYLRQLGTSSNPSRGKDFVVSLSTGKYIDEIQTIVKHIAAVAAQADGLKSEQIAERLDAISSTRIREKLVAVLGWRAAARGAVKRHMPQLLVACMKALGERFRSGKSSAAGGRPTSREGLLRLAARAGALTGLLSETKRELSDVEHTMASGGFIAFVEASAPELLHQEKRISCERAL
jgi:glycosyltransferase domain-containing protein